MKAKDVDLIQNLEMLLKNRFDMTTFIVMRTKFDEFLKSERIKGKEIAEVIGTSEVYWSQTKKKNPKNLTVLEIHLISKHFNIKPEKLFEIIMDENKK